MPRKTGRLKKAAERMAEAVLIQVRLKTGEISLNGGPALNMISGTPLLSEWIETRFPTMTYYYLYFKIGRDNYRLRLEKLKRGN